MDLANILIPNVVLAYVTICRKIISRTRIMVIKSSEPVMESCLTPGVSSVSKRIDVETLGQFHDGIGGDSEPTRHLLRQQSEMRSACSLTQSEPVDDEDDGNESDSSATSQLLADINDYSRSTAGKESFEDDAGLQKQWYRFKMGAGAGKIQVVVVFAFCVLFCVLIWMTTERRLICSARYDGWRRPSSPSHTISSPKGTTPRVKERNLLLFWQIQIIILDSSQSSYGNRFYYAQDVILTPGFPIDNPDAVQLLRSDSVSQWRHSEFSLFWLWTPVTGEGLPIQPHPIPNQAN
ncbi:hypothetical protein JCM33374_g4898 [Metschnikowia sp. JCM 33374]|nr:hypothetical protein JCM33374_g4898 [Metschnikowia sp. JCM 33374]